MQQILNLLDVHYLQLTWVTWLPVWEFHVTSSICCLFWKLPYCAAQLADPNRWGHCSSITSSNKLVCNKPNSALITNYMHSQTNWTIWSHQNNKLSEVKSWPPANAVSCMITMFADRQRTERSMARACAALLFEHKRSDALAAPIIPRIVESEVSASGSVVDFNFPFSIFFPLNTLKNYWPHFLWSLKIFSAWRLLRSVAVLDASRGKWFLWLPQHRASDELRRWYVFFLSNLLLNFSAENFFCLLRTFELMSISACDAKFWTC